MNNRGSNGSGPSLPGDHQHDSISGWRLDLDLGRRALVLIGLIVGVTCMRCRKRRKATGLLPRKKVRAEVNI